MKQRIEVFHSPIGNINSRSFVFPLHFFSNRLREEGIQLSINNKGPFDRYEGDACFLDSKIFKALWADPASKEKSLRVIEKARRSFDRVIWFNTSDCTSNIQRQVLPFVDRYMKGQVLRDKKLYQKPLYGGRVYTDFYHEVFGVRDSNELRSIPLTQGEISKIAVSWNLGMAGVFSYRRGLYSRLERRSGLLLSRRYPRKKGWVSVWEKKRDRQTEFPRVFARMSTNYSRETVSFQRQFVKRSLPHLSHLFTAVSPRRYFQELSSSHLSLSPFGWGEVNVRDFESVLSGTCLIKPNMGHLVTYPDIFAANETCIQFDWDFSNFCEIMDSVSQNRIRELAMNAYESYFRLIGDAGAESFVSKIKQIVTFD